MPIIIERLPKEDSQGKDIGLEKRRPMNNA